jgi:hypothetical protein
LRMRSISATEVPPNFMTRRVITELKGLLGESDQVWPG